MTLRETHRFLFDATKRGGHVHVIVRAGTARHDALPDGTETGDTLGGARAHAGTLIFRPEEWEALSTVLQAGVDEFSIPLHPDEPTIEVELPYTEES